MSDALKLADALMSPLTPVVMEASSEAAAELRRLQKENQQLREAHANQGLTILRFKGQRDTLLEALRWYVENDDVIESMPGNEFWVEGKRRAEAAIAKVEGSHD